VDDVDDSERALQLFPGPDARSKHGIAANAMAAEEARLRDLAERGIGIVVGVSTQY